jgi:hypothetical protein
MLFYVSLFLFCFALSVVMVWLFRSLNAVGKAVYRALLPSSKSNRPSRVEEEVGPATLNETRVPWGWKGSPVEYVPTEEAIAEPVTRSAPIPWGWPGNSGNREPGSRGKRQWGKRYRRHKTLVPVQPAPDEETEQQAQVGWPYRDEAFEFAGRMYRVKHAYIPLRGPRLGGVVRPWGW